MKSILIILPGDLKVVGCRTVFAKEGNCGQQSQNHNDQLIIGGAAFARTICLQLNRKIQGFNEFGAKTRIWSKQEADSRLKG
jgi:hypothetical protein